MDLTWTLALVASALRVYRDDDEKTPTEKPVRSYVGSVALLLVGFLILLLLVIALASGCAPRSPTSPAPVPATPDFEHPVLSEEDVKFLHELLDAHNRLRVEKGLNRLILRARLISAAQLQARYVYELQRAVHSNNDPQLATVADRARYVGYNWMSLGENAAYGQATTTDTMEAWTNSPMHLANILGPYDDVGFAVVGQNSRYGWIAVYGLHSTHGAFDSTLPRSLSQPEFTEKE